MRVMSGSVGDLPIRMLQDPADAQGAMVYDCRPPLLPVSLQLCDLGPLSARQTEVSASVAVPPSVDGQMIGMGSDVVVFRDLGVVPLVDSGTDLEDEFLMPDGTLTTVAVQQGEVALPEVCSAPRGVMDMELVKALLEVSVVPLMVMAIVDPMVVSVGSPALYPEPSLPVLPVDVQMPVLEAGDDPVPGSSPLREVAGSPLRECSPLLLASPAGSGCGPVTSPISPSLRMADVPGPPPRMATMDQYLPRDSASFMRESMDIPLLSRFLSPRPIVEGLFTGSTVDSSVGELVAVRSQCMPDLSREGPFDVHLNASEPGASPRVLASLPGCQYRMTSYDEENDRSDFSPAYGIHLHDPRLLEYVGAPDSARLLSRTLEYWLHHMGRERTLAADYVQYSGPWTVCHLA